MFSKNIISRRNNQGFSLIELLVSVSLMLAVMAAVLQLTNVGQMRQGFEQDIVSVQQTSREATEQMVREIRQAGYPKAQLYAESLNWTAANCNKISAGFTNITATNLVFQGDVDNDGIVEVVEYNLNGTTLTRSEVEKGSNGTIPSTDPQIFVENITSSPFSYYRWDSATNTWLSSSVTTANVVRVDINLTIRTNLKDPQSQQYRNVDIQNSSIAKNLL